MKPVTMLQPVNKQYEFKGAPTLVDGLKGNGNYKTGRWIAFYKMIWKQLLICSNRQKSAALLFLLVWKR